MKKYNKQSYNYLRPKDIDNMDKINRFINNYIVLNYTNENRIFNLDIYNSNTKIGTCKLKYDYEIRRFEEL